ncbi:hypothetical protein [Arthrobacter sp. CG_A4]|uniref:hypothetical protein n=1 Tax=Arthrobacter sp. CG_A4 TaxID=3071706 RepID=UPI002E087F23|nr:hypothetical protein [Arthrobacter sp. CG_A4]
MFARSAAAALVALASLTGIAVPSSAAPASRDVVLGQPLLSLYLDPLDDVVRRNGHSVYPGWDGSLQLLIDIKSDGESTYAAIEQELRKHPALMTNYSKGKVHTGPVTAVVSGNRPLTTMQAEDKRYGFFDGRSSDLAPGIPATLMPLISDNWTKLFSWQGAGPMPEAERAKLHAYVADAHTKGYRVRFWATPDQPGAARDAVWTELHGQVLTTLTPTTSQHWSSS